ncbi:MAG: hypothetical protein R2747_09700 [Pyrinomonadaceae bacterium]
MSFLVEEGDEQQQPKDKSQKEPQKLSASLRPIGSVGVDTVSDTLPVYYVIIGCGTAAVVNHTTLRQTIWGKKRIGDLPVMHIGFKDPWFHYYTHGMGQPPYLLTMPGYHQRPSQKMDVFDANPGCRSDRFAACTDNEWGLLWKKFHAEDVSTSKFHYLEGWVAVIQPKSDPTSAKILEVASKIKKEENLDIEPKIKEAYPPTAPPFRLLVVVPETETKWKLELVYAGKIDICTGAGRARAAGDFKPAKTKLWIPPRLWSGETRKRKLITGPEALTKETVWNSTDRIYVTGAGGIGLNMVERGEGEACYGDWVPARTLHQSFNLPRNDTVLRHPNKPERYNVNHAENENLKDFLEQKFKNAPEISVLVVPWLKSKKFKDKDELKKELIFKRSEIIVQRGRGADFFGNIANSGEIMDALDPAKFLEGARMKEDESGVREGAFLTATKTSVVLTPADKKWRFGEGSDLKVLKTGDMVTVKIEGSTDRRNPQKPPGIPKIRDFFEKDTGISEKGAFLLSEEYKHFCPALSQLKETEGGLYHRICVIQGLDPNELGEPGSIAAAFTFDGLKANGQTVGLQAEGGNIRVLGAAAQVHPKDLFKINTPNQTQARDNDPASLYFFTLPMSAVQPGFIYTGINIALANQYFDDSNPNYNVNTMAVDELEKWIKEKFAFDDPKILAEAVVKHRRLNNGYGDPEAIKQALKKEKSLDNLVGWEAVVEKLETNYPPALELVD